MNFIDTARHYGRGEAEARVGAAVRGRRDKVYLATKCGTLACGGGRDFSRRSLLGSVETSLAKLGTDYVDVLMLHSAGASHLAAGSEAIETLLGLQQAGKARFIGASLDGEVMWKALELDCLDVLQISYNLAELYVEEGFLAAAAQKQVGLVIKEPLAVGSFYRPNLQWSWVRHLWQRLQHYEFLKDESQITAPEVALRFVLSEPRIHTAIAATSNIEHLESNIALSDGRKLPDHLAAQIRACYRKAVAEVG